MKDSERYVVTEAVPHMSKVEPSLVEEWIVEQPKDNWCRSLVQKIDKAVVQSAPYDRALFFDQWPASKCHLQPHFCNPFWDQSAHAMCTPF